MAKKSVASAPGVCRFAGAGWYWRHQSLYIVHISTGSEILLSFV